MSEFELKERLAQEIFIDMMIEAGMDIRKIDYEEELQNIISSHEKVRLKEALADIYRHRHDFILVREERPLFLQVLYSDERFNKRRYTFDRGLYDAALVFITAEEPFFEIAYVKEFVRAGILRPITNNEILILDEKMVDKYKQIIRSKFKD